MSGLRFAAGFWSTALVIAFVISGCSSGDSEPTLEQGVPEFSIVLTSPAFADGSAIPTQYTCDGQEDLSPPLQWSGVPEGTRSIALISDDPDAPRGTWVHWVLYSIPSDVTELAEGVASTDVLPNGAKHGKNDFGRRNYGGPCPPSGNHRYFFKVYALDTEIDLEPGAVKKHLLSAMDGRILAQGQLMGTYQRR